MYKVFPWDEPNKIFVFDSFIDALQFGNNHYGSRYDLEEDQNLKNIYWINDNEDMIYEATVSDTVEGIDGKQTGFIVYRLELRCGKEYPTENFGINSMKWCSPEYFVEDVQDLTVVQYFEEESMLDAMVSEGLSPWSGPLPHIYEWVDED